MGGEGRSDSVSNGRTREPAPNSKGTQQSGDASSATQQSGDASSPTQHWRELSPSAPKSCSGAAAQLHPHSPTQHLGTKAPRFIE